MTILKLALLGSLRIALLGSLKVALLVYTLFLSETAIAGAVTEGKGNVGDLACCGATESRGSSNANIA